MFADDQTVVDLIRMMSQRTERRYWCRTNLSLNVPNTEEMVAPKSMFLCVHITENLTWS